MKKWCLFILALTATVAGANPSALDCVERIRAKFGDQTVAGIVELTGTKGQPQPEEWWLLSYDPRAPYKLHYYWADASRVTDEGFDDDVYRDGGPDGFLNFSKVRLDSTDVFKLSNAESLKAAVIFDRIDYRLYCRPFSDEPIWSVKLYNRGRYVGKLDYSASDGSLLRSRWIQYGGDRFRGSVDVRDSAFPGSAPPDQAVASGPTIPGSPDPDSNLEPSLDPGLDPGLTPAGPEPASPDSSNPAKYPTAIPIAERPGYVRSPYQPDAGLVDVRGLDPGTPAHCPYSGKIFLVP